MVDFYLLAFGPLRTVFSEKELQDFVDAMAERGIRMRQSFEDVVDVKATSTIREDEQDSGSESPMDEIEYRAQELRRLRPY